MVNCVGANSRKTELCPSAASKAQALQKAPSPRLLWLTAVIWGEGGRVESAPPVLYQRRKEVLVHSYEFCPLLSYCFFSQKGHGVKLISLLLFPQGCRNCGICLSHWGAAAWFTAWRRMSVRADLTRKKKCVSFLRRSTAGLKHCKRGIRFLLSSAATWRQCLCCALSSPCKCSLWWELAQSWCRGLCVCWQHPCLHSTGTSCSTHRSPRWQMLLHSLSIFRWRSISH